MGLSIRHARSGIRRELAIYEIVFGEARLEAVPFKTGILTDFSS
jgi:hypothetical protein